MRFRRFSPRQRQVLTWWCGPETRDRETIICDGAVRSGKTLCLGLSFFCWAMGTFRGQRFGLCGKTAVSLRRNLLETVRPALEELGLRSARLCQPQPGEGALRGVGEHLLPLRGQGRGQRRPDPGRHPGGGAAG